MEIQLSTPLVRESETSVVKVLKWEDSPDDHTVKALVQVFPEENPRLYTLWCGADYEAIGDWTTAQAVVRLNQLIKANVFSLPPNDGE